MTARDEAKKGRGSPPARKRESASGRGRPPVSARAKAQSRPSTATAKSAARRPPARPASSTGAAKGKAPQRAGKAESCNTAPDRGKPRRPVERGENASCGTANEKARQQRHGLAGLLARISPRIAILAMLLVVFAAFSFGPTMRNLQATSDLKHKQKELAAAKAETAKLEASVKEAQSLSFVDSEARKQRLVAPGEVLYLVTSDRDSSKIEYRVKSLQSMDEAWERVRLMLNCNQSRVPAETK